MVRTEKPYSSMPPTLYVEEGDDIEDLDDYLGGELWYGKIVIEPLGVELAASQEHNVTTRDL